MSEIESPALTVESTLAELPRESEHVAADMPVREVKAFLDERPRIAGVLLVGRDGSPQAVSRDLFQEALNKPYVWDVFSGRPVEEFLRVLEAEPLVLACETPIRDALERALERPANRTYEPLVVVDTDGRPTLLRVHDLLLAQTRILRLLNEEIRMQKDSAEVANRTKSWFLANMSHELRTPMNGILGMTDILLESRLDDDQREHLRVVRHSAGWLLGLLNDILDLSKLEAGKLSLVELPFQPRETVDGVIRVLRFQAERKGIELNAEVDERVPDWLQGDDGRLRQILVNLVGNAIKFTESGGVTVRLRATLRDDQAFDLIGEVSDTGIGVEPDKLAHIFRPFEQVDSTSTRQHGGSGLGLSICSQLVHLMQGEIDAESRSGEGSTFSFRIRLQPAFEREEPAVIGDLPAKVPSGDAPAGDAPAGDAGPEPTVLDGTPRRLRILLAEDNVVNQKVATLQLRRLGHVVEVVGDGAAAVEAAARETFDLVLMDLQMPHVDGLEATRRIRQAERRRWRGVSRGSDVGAEGLAPDELRWGDAGYLPIVALTAHALVGDRQRCLDAGMDEYMTKPFSAADLADMLDRMAVAPVAPVAPEDGR